MTRDDIAAAAMQGILASGRREGIHTLAEQAYRIADAMLAERDQRANDGDLDAEAK